MGMTAWRHCCPVRQTEPRVSPVPRGRNGQAQDHASKEETAPAGVAVVSIGRTKQGFHPGLRPRPQQTVDGWTRRQVAGLNHHRRRHLVVDGGALITNHHRSNHPYSTDRGPRWPDLRGEGPLLLPEPQLRPPLALAEDHLVDHHRPDLACRLQQRGNSAVLQAASRRQVATSTGTPEGRITARSQIRAILNSPRILNRFLFMLVLSCLHNNVFPP
jgi:hypothetical protein